MALLEYLKSLESPESVAQLAGRCGTSPAHLMQIARGYRRAGEYLCINLDRETSGRIRCEDLRPDVDWAYLRASGTKNDQAA